MKKIFLLIAFLLLGFALTSCTTTTADKTYVEEGATKITIYAREFEQWSKDHLKSLVNEFNSNLTDGIQVEVKFYTQDTYSDALTVARENGKSPDLFMSTYGDLYTNINGNYCAPITSYLSAEAQADILPACLDMVTYNDEIYAYPWNLEPGSLLFYRKDILEAAGVTKVPTTWEELYEACEKIQKNLDKGQYCIGMPLGSSECTWVTYGLQKNTTGGLALDDSWQNVLIDSEGYEELAEFFYNIFINGYAPTASLTSEGYTYIVDALCTGTLAMTFAGSWCAAEVYDYTDSNMDIVNNIGIAPIPTIDGDQTKCTSANGGWCYCISEESKNKDKAAEFLNWLFTEDTARTASYFIAAYNSKAATSYSVQEYLDQYESDILAEWSAVINDVASKGIPEATYPWDISQEVGKIYETMELNCKTASFDALYAKALQTAESNIATIMSRSSFPRNPKYDYGD